MSARGVINGLGLVLVATLVGAWLVGRVVVDSPPAGEQSVSVDPVAGRDSISAIRGKDAPRATTRAAAGAPRRSNARAVHASSSYLELDHVDLLRFMRGRLASPDPHERITAILQLDGLDTSRAHELLTHVLASDDDPDVRREAIAALGRIGDAQALARLASSLNDPDAGVRDDALYELAESGSEVLPTLGQVLIGNPDPALREWALRRLADDEGPAADALLQLAMSDTDELVSALAHRLAETRGFLQASRHALPATASDLADGEPSLDVDPHRSTSLSGPLDSLQALGDVVAYDPDVFNRVEALEALAAYAEGGAYAGPAWQLLESAFADPEAPVREAALWAMAGRGPDMVPVVSQVVFGDPDPELRRQAIELLSLDDGLAATAVLWSAINDTDPQVSEAAARFIVDRGADLADAASEPVQPTSDDGPFDARLALERAVDEQLLDAEAQAVVGDLQESDELGHGSRARAIEVILANNTDVRVREVAIEALAEIGSEAAHDAMTIALGDDDVEVRQLAQETLWDVAGPRVQLMGQVLFGDPDYGPRRTALLLLARDKGAAATALLRAATVDTDADIRALAREIVNERGI